MTTSLESILHEALCFEAGAFDDDQAISSAELVEWFAEWRRRARTVVGSHRPTPTAAIYRELFRSQLLGALRALQLMQERAEVEGPRRSRSTHREYYPPTEAEIDELIHALDHGGIHFTCGQLRAMVFKHPAKERHANAAHPVRSLAWARARKGPSLLVGSRCARDRTPHAQWQFSGSTRGGGRDYLLVRQCIASCSPSRTRAGTPSPLRRSSILDRCARRDSPEAGNPAQDTSGDFPMTQTPHAEDSTPKVQAYLVLEDARIGTLPRHFGARMMTVERTVYHFMREFVAKYQGAFWDFYELSNGGFYMAPNGGAVKFTVHTNGFEGTLSADAAGITVCLFTFSHLSFQQPNQEMFSRHFYALREFAMDHREAQLIFAAID